MITDEQEAAYNEWRKTAAYPHDPLCTFVAGVEYGKFTHPAPAQPVRLSKSDIDDLNADDAFIGNCYDIANAIQDAMLTKGAVQPAVMPVVPLKNALEALEVFEKLFRQAEAIHKGLMDDSKVIDCAIRVGDLRKGLRAVYELRGLQEPAVVQPLYDALSETQLDLTILLGNIFASASKDKNWEGMYDVVNGWITRNHKAIAQAQAAPEATVKESLTPQAEAALKAVKGE